MLTTRGSLRTNQRITECHNNHLSRNRMWQGLTLLKPMERRLMLGIYLIATSRAHVVNLKATITCYECGRLRHFRNECQKLRNQNQVNQIWKEKARENSRLLGHPFNIDLMLVELGSFDVIIGMDWLANHHAVITCDEKIVHIPNGDEVLIVQGDRDVKGEKYKLSIISCTKTQKYIKRGYLIFLAQVTKKETKDKSEEKRLEDVPTVRDFPEDLPGLLPT
ncbi:putative reverse transcriptase domain-containing protein [Tanacetum coccineum]